MQAKHPGVMEGGRLLTTKQHPKDERTRIPKRERANESDYQCN